MRAWFSRTISALGSVSGPFTPTAPRFPRSSHLDSLASNSFMIGPGQGQWLPADHLSAGATSRTEFEGGGGVCRKESRQWRSSSTRDQTRKLTGSDAQRGGRQKQAA